MEELNNAPQSAAPQTADSQTQPTYARRPVRQHQRPEQQRDAIFWVRNVLNIIFIILAIVGVAMYCFKHLLHNTAVIIIIVGVVLKFIEASLRIFHK